MGEGEENGAESNDRSLALSPTWSVALVLTVFVVVSLIVERSIYRLSTWLRKTKRKPLFAALEKMKEELMLLGFISLLLTATSSTIANICVPSSFYNLRFVPCTRSEIKEEELENESSVQRNLLTKSFFFDIFRRRRLGEGIHNRATCSEGHEPFVSYEGLEQLHRFIFIMAVTHVTYSCLTMLLAIVKVASPFLHQLKFSSFSKNISNSVVLDLGRTSVFFTCLIGHASLIQIHSWRIWEDVARIDRHDFLTGERE